MSKVRVSAFAVSLDGYAAGTRQSLENPLGIGGPQVIRVVFLYAHMEADAGAGRGLNWR
jgi:hypothetical protein